MKSEIHASTTSTGLHTATYTPSDDLPPVWQSFQEMSPQEQRELFESIRSTMTPERWEDWAEHLEVFIATRTVTSDELVALVEHLPPHARADIGEFLGLHSDPTPYVQTLSQCWDTLLRDTQEQIVHRLGNGTPEQILAIAPFAYLPKSSSTEKSSSNNAIRPGERPHEFYGRLQETREQEKQKSTATPRVTPPAFITSALSNYESAREFMSSALRFSDRHTLTDYIDRISNTCPSFLVPYMRELTDRQILDPKQVETIMYNKTSSWGENIPKLHEGTDAYATKQEQETLKEITRQAERAGASKSSYDWPRHLQAKYEALQDARRLRTAQHLLADMEQFRTYYPTQREFSAAMIEMSSSALPILCVLQEKGLPKNELLSIARACFDYDGRISGQSDFIEYKSLIKAGLEPFATRCLAHEIKENTYNLSENLYRHLGTVLSWFSGENQLRLAKAIDDHCPEIWLDRLDCMAQHSNLSLTDLSKRLSEDTYVFRSSYNKLHRATMAHDATDQSPAELRAELLQQARAVVATHPELIFKASFVDQVYSKEQQQAFIQEQLSQTHSPKFLGSLLENYKELPSLQGEHTRIREAIVRTPEIIKEAIDATMLWSRLSPFLSRGERADLLLGQMQSMDLTDVFDATAAMDDILVSPQRTRQLLEIIDARGTVRLIPPLIEEISSYKEYRAKHANPELDIRFAESLTLIDQAMTAACSEHKFLAYNEDIRKYLGQKVNAHIVQHLDEYCALFPEDLPNLHEHLPEDIFEEALFSHIRCIAILRTDNGEPIFDKSYLPYSVEQEIKALSPWDPSAPTAGEAPDRYQQILANIASSPLYEVHADRLERIATREVKEKGLRPDLSNYDLDKEFISLVQTVALGGSSDFAREHAPEILSLDPAAQRQICQQLELAAVYSLDEDLPTGSLHDSIAVLQGRIGEHLRSMFNLEESLDPASIGSLDIRLLQAMGVYYRARCIGEPVMESGLKLALTTAAQGTYEESRAWGVGCNNRSLEDKRQAVQQLQAQGLIPQEMNLESYQKWVDTIQLERNIDSDYNQSDILRAARRVLQQAVADHHIEAESLASTTEDAQGRYEALLDPLHEPVRRKAELIAAIKAARRDGQDVSDLEEECATCATFIQEYRADHAEDIEKVQGQLIISALQAGTVGDLSKGSLTAGKWKFPVHKVAGILQTAFTADAPGFITDIRQIQDLLNLSTQKTATADSASTYRITDRVDQSVYFLIGQQPVQSCQHFNSTMNYNQGLLSYVTDPNVKILQVYTHNDTLVARSVLRLLADENGYPQLFMERCYSADPNPRVAELLKAGAIAKAQSLGVGLYSHSSEGADGDFEDGTTTLSNNGSRSRYVYSDAAGGLQFEGRFTMQDASRVA